MAIYDAEGFLRDCIELLKNNLNTEIAAINTEKSDQYTIQQIKQDNYILEPFDYEILTEETLSYSQPVTAEIEDSEYSSAYASSIEVEFKINILDGSNNQEAKLSNLYKLLRYQRAIYQAFAKNINRFRGYTKPEIFQVNEVFFTRNNNLLVRSAGIRLKSVLGNNAL